MAAGVLATLSVVSGKRFPNGYPDDNSMALYRESDERYAKRWPTPKAIVPDGSEPDPARKQDVSVYPWEWDPNAPWTFIDFLYPSRWEREFESEVLRLTLRDKVARWGGPHAAVIYLILLYLGQKFMEQRKPFDLKTPLAMWNLFLAIYSFCGLIRVVPHLCLMLYHFGFEYTLCRAGLISYGNGAVGFWIFLFIFSKYVELIDTVFLVLRKKSVPLLHWYHHCSVLLYCWHAYLNEIPAGIYFAAMNYAVHTVMYFYYFLAAVLPKPPRWATYVTIFQLSQMVVGIYITVQSLLTYRNGIKNCDCYVVNLQAAGIMYLSYFLLFAKFFVERYFFKSKPGKKSEEKKIEEKKKD